MDCPLIYELVDTRMERELAIMFLTVRDIRARCRFVFKGLDGENVEIGGLEIEFQVRFRALIPLKVIPVE